MDIAIRRAAVILGVGTRTISRALSGSPNGHYHPEDFVTTPEELGLVYDCDPEVIIKASAYPVDPKHILIKSKEAANYLGIPERTFRYRQRRGYIKPVLRNGKTVRFTREYLDTIKD